jgi:hypothetical protein
MLTGMNVHALLFNILLRQMTCCASLRIVVGVQVGMVIMNEN